MKRLSCIITDDEPVARKILKEFIEQVPFLELAGQFENITKTEAFLKQQKADILFLDIEMPKVTGLEYLKSASMQPLVILTTAYPEYALEGYELNIIDYLLKPIAFDRFVKSVQKAKEFMELKQMRPGDPSPTYLFVRSEKRFEKIELSDILYVESTGNYVNIYAANKRIVAYLTLKAVEGQLPASQFFKIHHSFLVNFHRVDSIEGNLVMIAGKELPVGRNYKEGLMRAIEERLLKR